MGLIVQSIHQYSTVRLIASYTPIAVSLCSLRDAAILTSHIGNVEFLEY